MRLILLSGSSSIPAVVLPPAVAGTAHRMSITTPAGEGGIPVTAAAIASGPDVYELQPSVTLMRDGTMHTHRIVVRSGQAPESGMLTLSTGEEIEIVVTGTAPVAATMAELLAHRQAHIDAGNTGDASVTLRRGVDFGDLTAADIWAKPAGGQFRVIGESLSDMPRIGRVLVQRGALALTEVGGWLFDTIRFDLPIDSTLRSLLQVAGEDITIQNCDLDLNVTGPLDPAYVYRNVDPGLDGVQKAAIYASYSRNLRVLDCTFGHFGDGLFIASVGGLEVTGNQFEYGHNDYIRVWGISAGVKALLGDPPDVAFPVGIIAYNTFRNFLADSSRLHPDFIHVASFSVGDTNYLPGMSLLLIVGNLMYLGESQIATTGVIDRVLNNPEASLENVTTNLVMDWPGYGNLFDNVLAYAQPSDGQILEIELPDPATSWWVSTGQSSPDTQTFAAVTKQTESSGIVRVRCRPGTTFDLVLPDGTIEADRTEIDITIPLDSYQWFAVSATKFRCIEPPRGHQGAFTQLNGMHQLSGMIALGNIIYVNSTAGIRFDPNNPALDLYRRVLVAMNTCMPVITGDADGDGYANAAEDGSALGRNAANLIIGDNGTNWAGRNVSVKTVTGANIAWPDNTSFGSFFQDTIPTYFDVAAPSMVRTLHPFTDQEAIDLARPRAGSPLPAGHGALTADPAADHIDYLNRRPNRPAPVLNAIPDWQVDVGVEAVLELAAFRGADLSGTPGPVFYWLIDNVRRIAGTTVELPKTDGVQVDPVTGRLTFTAGEAFADAEMTVLLVGLGGMSELRTMRITATGSAPASTSIAPDFDFMSELPTTRSGTTVSAIPDGYEITAGESSPRLRWDLSGAGLTDGQQYVMYWNANTTGNVMIRAWSSPEFTGTSTLYYNEVGGSGAMLITFDASRPYFEYLHLSAGVGSVTQVTGFRLEPWLATVWPGSIADWAAGDGAPSLFVNEGDLVFDGTGAMVSGKHTVSGLQDMQIVVNVDTISGGVLLDIVTDNIALGADLDVQVGRNVLTLTAADNGTPTSTDIEVSLYAPVSGTVRISSIYIEEA
ncbi:MAG: hypothetical protein AAFU34_15520 [Pseudomonadota bacterium]